MYTRKLWNLSAGFALLLSLPFGAHGQSGSSTARMTTAISPASGIQLRVECGSPKAPLKSIGAALKLVGNLPATLMISGTCRENVVIQSLDRVTLQGNPTATIDGGNDPNFDAVDIIDSLNIGLSNLTITGGASGVVCSGHSLCRLIQSTVQNSLGAGAIDFGSYLGIGDSVIQNNGNAGLVVGTAASVNFFGGSITGNAADGIMILPGGILEVQAGDLNSTVTIQNNGGGGINARFHDTVVLNGANITGNAGDGLSVQAGSAATISGSNITNNLGHQVRIGDLSIARFAGSQSNTIHGANFPDVICDPQFSATRKFANLAGTSTNCPAELPPTP